MIPTLASQELTGDSENPLAIENRTPLTDAELSRRLAAQLYRGDQLVQKQEPVQAFPHLDGQAGVEAHVEAPASTDRDVCNRLCSVCGSDSPWGVFRLTTQAPMPGIATRKYPGHIPLFCPLAAVVTAPI